MPITHTVSAIVLRRHDVGEADRLLVVFTDTLGKLTLKARGVRKTLSKLAGHLEPLTVATLTFVEGKAGIGTVTHATATRVHEGIRKSLSKTALALHLGEMLDRATDEKVAYPALHELLKDGFEVLEKRPNLLSLKPAFIIKLLSGLGFRLESNQCAACGQALDKEHLGFSAAAGGIVSGDCAASAQPLTVYDVKYIRALHSIPLDHVHRLRIPSNLVLTSTHLLDDAFSYHTQTALNSKEFYDSLKSRLAR